jgi:hypothetical protein
LKAEDKERIWKAVERSDSSQKGVLNRTRARLLRNCGGQKPVGKEKTVNQKSEMLQSVF